MPKEWILNSAINRWGLQKKRMVGAVSEEIRKCQPKRLEDWRDYYFKNVHSIDHLRQIGKTLYSKINGILKKEINDISEEDCVNYVVNLVINCTFDGYRTEIKTIYEQLQKILNVKIEPAPDPWDRLYNVDFFIRVNDKYVGLQIKPAAYSFITQMIREKNIQKEAHQKFTI